MEKTFHFVDGAQVGRTNRSLIRSHVMKGKNAGRKVHRPSKLMAKRRPDNYNSFQRISCLPKDEGTNVQSTRSYQPIIDRNFQNALLTLSFLLGFELTPN